MIEIGNHCERGPTLLVSSGWGFVTLLYIRINQWRSPALRLTPQPRLSIFPFLFSPLPISPFSARDDSRSDYAATNNIPFSPHHSASQNPHGRDASHVPNCCSKPPRRDSTYGSRRNQHRRCEPLPRTPRSTPAQPKPPPASPPQHSETISASSVPPAQIIPQLQRGGNPHKP